MAASTWRTWMWLPVVILSGSAACVGRIGDPDPVQQADAPLVCDGTSIDGGDPHNNLLVSLGRAMELDMTSFGNPAYCTGPLAKM